MQTWSGLGWAKTGVWTLGPVVTLCVTLSESYALLGPEFSHLSSIERNVFPTLFSSERYWENRMRPHRGRHVPLALCGQRVSGQASPHLHRLPLDRSSMDTYEVSTIPDFLRN